MKRRCGVRVWWGWGQKERKDKKQKHGLDLHCTAQNGYSRRRRDITNKPLFTALTHSLAQLASCTVRTCVQSLSNLSLPRVSLAPLSFQTRSIIKTQCPNQLCNQLLILLLPCISQYHLEKKLLLIELILKSQDD